MSKNVKNNLKNVKIGGNYTGGDSNNITSSSNTKKSKISVKIIVALISAVAVIAAAIIKVTFS